MVESRSGFKWWSTIQKLDILDVLNVRISDPHCTRLVHHSNPICNIKQNKPYPVRIGVKILNYNEDLDRWGTLVSFTPKDETMENAKKTKTLLY